MKKATIIILSVILFQGCLLKRLEESRNQLCSGQIELSTKGLISVVFNRPTLYPDDITKILGKKPSKNYDQANKRYFEYKVTRKGDASGNFDIPVKFEFIEKDGRYYLSKATAYININKVLPEPLVKNLFSKVCYAKRKGNKVKIKFDDVPLNDLPNIEEIKSLLGKTHPSEVNTYTYFYELNSLDTAKIEIFYDIESDKPKDVVVTFFRYKLKVDFEEKIAVGQLKDLITSLKLGFLIAFSR